MSTSYLRFPCEYVALGRGYSSSHHGIDMGWHRNNGGPNIPVYSPGEGTVVEVVDNQKNCYPSGPSNAYGNYVKIRHNDNKYSLMAHLQTGILVKQGDHVTMHQHVGFMGNTGYSSGNHVHFEIFDGGSTAAYKVDPLKYVYAYPDDVVGPTTAVTYPIMYHEPDEGINVTLVFDNGDIYSGILNK